MINWYTVSAVQARERKEDATAKEVCMGPLDEHACENRIDDGEKEGKWKQNKANAG